MSSDERRFRYCPYCGREVDPSYSFCPYCGGDLRRIRESISGKATTSTHPKEVRHVQPARVTGVVERGFSLLGGVGIATMALLMLNFLICFVELIMVSSSALDVFSNYENVRLHLLQLANIGAFPNPGEIDLGFGLIYAGTVLLILTLIVDCVAFAASANYLYKVDHLKFRNWVVAALVAIPLCGGIVSSVLMYLGASKIIAGTGIAYLSPYSAHRLEAYIYNDVINRLLDGLADPSMLFLGIVLLIITGVLSYVAYSRMKSIPRSTA